MQGRKGWGHSVHTPAVDGLGPISARLSPAKRGVGTPSFSPRKSKRRFCLSLDRSGCFDVLEPMAIRTERSHKGPLTPPAKRGLCRQVRGLFEASHGGMGFGSSHSPTLASLASDSYYARVLSSGRVNTGGDTMPMGKVKISLES